MKVLIVDDSKVMRALVRRTFRQAGHGHHDFCEAENGRHAIEVIRSEAPDLVVCDWNMPQMTGIELLEALRAAGNQVQFGFITSEGSDDFRARASAAGAAFLVTKPVTPDSLAAALEPVRGIAC